MVITTRNILRLLLNEDLVLFIDLTYKYSWNQWPFHILEVSDKHYYFHPIGYMFGSNEDSDSHALFTQSVLDTHVQLFGNKLAIKHTSNSNYDIIFKAFSIVFLSVFILNCFVCIITRNLPKHACKLLSINIMKSIEKELNQLGNLVHKQDFEEGM